MNAEIDKFAFLAARFRGVPGAFSASILELALTVKKLGFAFRPGSGIGVVPFPLRPVAGKVFVVRFRRGRIRRLRFRRGRSIVSRRVRRIEARFGNGFQLPFRLFSRSGSAR